jgi:hypothetical protein
MCTQASSVQNGLKNVQQLLAPFFADFVDGDIWEHISSKWASST